MTHDTIIEPVRPVIPTSAPRVDAWRWKDCVGYETYVARVREQEAARAAARKAAA